MKTSRIVLLTVLVSVCLAMVATPALAQDANNTSDTDSDDDDVEYNDDDRIYSVGSVYVPDEDWGDSEIVVVATEEQTFSVAKKNSVTSSQGTIDYYDIEEGESLTIDLDGASWYSVASDGEFNERTSSTSLSLFQTAAKWSFVVRAFLVTLIGVVGLLRYRHWQVTREREKGAKSMLSNRYIKNIPAHSSDEDDEKEEDDQRSEKEGDES